MAKKIKCYTSTVSVERTIASIEQLLVDIGASHIEKQYNKGMPVSIIFSMPSPDNTVISFKLPAHIDEALVIMRTIPEYRNKGPKWIEAQSQRTAWRIVLNWVEAQVAMIQLNQVSPLQLFLPHVFNRMTGETFYEVIVRDNCKLLLTYGE